MSDIDFTKLFESITNRAYTELECKCCKYWKQGKEKVEGYCTRFPEWIETYFDHYCGEFKERDGE